MTRVFYRMDGGGAVEHLSERGTLQQGRSLCGARAKVRAWVSLVGEDLTAVNQCPSTVCKRCRKLAWNPARKFETRRIRSIDIEGESDRAASKLRVDIDVSPDAILFRPEGTGDLCSMPGTGWPILIEFRDGVPFLVVWGDITQEDPTHTIDLSGALESNRIWEKEAE